MEVVTTTRTVNVQRLARHMQMHMPAQFHRARIHFAHIKATLRDLRLLFLKTHHGKTESLKPPRNQVKTGSIRPIAAAKPRLAGNGAGQLWQHHAGKQAFQVTLREPLRTCPQLSHQILFRPMGQEIKGKRVALLRETRKVKCRNARNHRRAELHFPLLVTKRLALSHERKDGTGTDAVKTPHRIGRGLQRAKARVSLREMAITREQSRSARTTNRDNHGIARYHAPLICMNGISALRGLDSRSGRARQHIDRQLVHAKTQDIERGRRLVRLGIQAAIGFGKRTKPQLGKPIPNLAGRADGKGLVHKGGVRISTRFHLVIRPIAAPIAAYQDGMPQPLALLENVDARALLGSRYGSGDA